MNPTSRFHYSMGNNCERPQINVLSHGCYCYFFLNPIDICTLIFSCCWETLSCFKKKKCIHRPRGAKKPCLDCVIQWFGEEGRRGKYSLNLLRAFLVPKSVVGHDFSLPSVCGQSSEARFSHLLCRISCHKECVCQMSPCFGGALIYAERTLQSLS